MQKLSWWLKEELQVWSHFSNGDSRVTSSLLTFYKNCLSSSSRWIPDLLSWSILWLQYSTLFLAQQCSLRELCRTTSNIFSGLLLHQPLRGIMILGWFNGIQIEMKETKLECSRLVKHRGIERDQGVRSENQHISVTMVDWDDDLRARGN